MSTRIILFCSVLLWTIGCKNETTKTNTTEGTKEEVVQEEATNKATNTPVEETKTMYEPVPDGMTIEKVLDNYFNAIGGKQKLEGIKTLVSKADVVLDGEKMTVITKEAAPNKFSTTFTTTSGETQRQYFDGTAGFFQMGNQEQPLGEMENEIFKNETLPFQDFAYHIGILQGIAEVDGKKAYVISIKDKDIFYDVASGLKVKDISAIDDPETGKLLKLPTYYKDYKSVKGIKMPHTVLQDMGDAMMEIKYNSYEFNTKLTDKDFE